jgi:hypothetical protein
VFSYNAPGRFNSQSSRPFVPTAPRGGRASRVGRHACVALRPPPTRALAYDPCFISRAELCRRWREAFYRENASRPECALWNWVCVRGIRPNVRCDLNATIPVARRLRLGRAEGRCLASWAQTRGFFVCETEYGVSFARPDCARIEEGSVWAKPDLIPTGSLFVLVRQVLVTRQ